MVFTMFFKGFIDVYRNNMRWLWEIFSEAWFLGIRGKIICVLEDFQRFSMGKTSNNGGFSWIFAFSIATWRIFVRWTWAMPVTSHLLAGHGMIEYRGSAVARFLMPLTWAIHVDFRNFLIYSYYGDVLLELCGTLIYMGRERETVYAKFRPSKGVNIFTFHGDP